MFFVLLPLYKIWGGASFFNAQNHWETRAMNYEIHSISKEKRSSYKLTERFFIFSVSKLNVAVLPLLIIILKIL